MARSFIDYAKRSFILMFGGIWLLAGLPFLGAGITGALIERRLLRDGEIAIGVVLEKRIHTSTKSPTRHTVHYRFTTASGKTVTTDSDLPFERWDPLELQAPIPVRYLAVRPTINRPDLGDNWLRSIRLSGFGLVLSVIGGVLAFRGIARIRRNMRLEREGVLTTGTVTSLEQTGLKVNGRVQWRIHYQFNDRQGRTVNGKTEVRPWEDVGRFPEGASGKVRFDPENTSWSLWLG